MTTGTVIRSQYKGICDACGERWSEGELIRAQGSFGSRSWVHETCPDPLELKASESVCTKCFLVHPLGTCGE